jgi:hypothetical protein
VAAKISSGWAFSTVVTLQSRTPLTFFDYNSTNVFGTTGDFANIDLNNTGCGGHLSLGGSVRSRLSEYFNTNCFTPPPVISPSDDGTGFGDSSPGIMREGSTA